jgi:transposase
MTTNEEVSTSREVDTTLTVATKRRRWPKALIREMVAASLEPGSSVSIVARQYDVNANQLFKWRRQLGVPSRRASGEPVQLLPVQIAAAPPSTLTVLDGTTRGSSPAAAAPSPAVPGSIEIELRRGRRIKITGSVDPALVTAALRVVARP